METLQVAAGRHESEFISPSEKLAEELIGGGSPLAVRDAMIRLAELEQEADDLGKTLTAIAERYRVKKERMEAERETLRQGIEVYLLRFTEDGKEAFPDVGTAYLATQKPKVEVVDKQAFEEWAKERGHTVEAVDLTAAKKAVIETGEAAPGVEVTPERKAVRVKAA